MGSDCTEINRDLLVRRLSSGRAMSEKLPTKLNLGCGFDIREGYLNVDVNDFHKPDLIANITDLAMLPSGYFQELLAQDVLEHLPRGKVESALAEWYRLLSADGEIRLRVPNLNGAFQLLQQGHRQQIAEMEKMVQCIYGTQAYEGDFHLSGYTPRLLSHYLTQIGFKQVQITTHDHWLMDVRAKKESNQSYPSPNLIENDAVCISGWHELDESAGIRYRWSKGRSLINILQESGRQLVLECRTFDPYVSLGQLEISFRLSHEGTPIKKLTVTSPDLISLQFPIVSNDYLLQIATSRTFMPAAVLGNDDLRHLGVAFSTIRVL